VDLQKLVELLVAGGMAGLIGAAVMAWKTRRDADRDDRQQRTNEATGAATAAKTLTDAATAIVKLQDDQVDEFKQQIRALQAESSALGTRLDNEIQKRLRAEATTNSIGRQVDMLRDQLANVKAQFEIADLDRQMLRRENGAMKTKLFDLSVGVATLIKQVREAGMTPIYVLEVPVLDDQSTQPLGDLKM
jgi:predicted RNase H-like nuclease (RuvC/YqgF family)